MYLFKIQSDKTLIPLSAPIISQSFYSSTIPADFNMMYLLLIMSDFKELFQVPIICFYGY